jgi:N-acetylmuramoyl-L-alanine amidase
MKVVILGTAHGKNVGGKRSPDNSLEEYRYSREIVNRLRIALEARGCVVYVDMPEDIVPLPQQQELRLRCSYVNNLCKKYGKDKCLYVSIHVNAAGGEGKWMLAGGWCAYTSKGTTVSDTLAEHLYEAAEKHLSGYAEIMEEGKKDGLYSSKQTPIRTDMSDGDKDLEADFFVLKHAACAAVLTENLFMDNKRDVSFLLSEKGKQSIVALHRDGILNFIDQ